MAWLDETLSLKIPAGEGQQVLGGIFQSLLKILREEKAAIGHIGRNPWEPRVCGNEMESTVRLVQRGRGKGAGSVRTHGRADGCGGSQRRR